MVCFHGQDFADRFGVHSVSVSLIFNNALYLLYECLKFLIIWPERKAIRKTLPVAFREECPSCTCIIDCFEVFIENHPITQQVVKHIQTTNIITLQNT